MSPLFTGSHAQRVKIFAKKKKLDTDEDLQHMKRTWTLLKAPGHHEKCKQVQTWLSLSHYCSLTLFLTVFCIFAVPNGDLAHSGPFQSMLTHSYPF